MLRAQHDGSVTDVFDESARRVRLLSGFTAEPSRARTISRAIGVGRLVIGSTLLLAPVLSVRMLGTDSATAKRMSFLARTTAARDIGLGLGTLLGGGDRERALWLGVGAAADAADAVVIAAAMRQGTTRGALAVGIVAGAAAVAAAGFWAALGLRRRD